MVAQPYDSVVTLHLLDGLASESESEALDADEDMTTYCPTCISASNFILTLKTGF
jgi:hypothetical protein